MSEPTTYPVSEDIQKRIVAMFLSDFAGFVQNCDIVKPEFFDNPVLQDFVVILYQFFGKYKRTPRQDEFIEEVGRFTSQNPRLLPVEYDKLLAEVLSLVGEAQFDYVKDRARIWARIQAVKQALVGSIDVLKRQTNLEEILDKVKSALAIGEDHADLGAFYFDTVDQRLASRASGRVRSSYAIPTWVSGINHLLGGGLAKGELGVAMGPWKRGKTILSINFSCGALYAGYKVAHYIMEGSEERLQNMYDSCISGVEKDHLKEHEEEVKIAMQEFLNNPTNGRLVVKHFPALFCTPLKVENHLTKLRMMTGFTPDLLILDYLGLIRPASRMAEDSKKYDIYGQITKELLSLAQRGDYAVWLLHQTTRESGTKDLVDCEDSADSIEPMRDADMIITLNQTKAESEMNPPIMRIFLAGGREVADRRVATVAIDKERSKVYDVETEANK